MGLRTNCDYLLYSIKRLVFITETECVYCAVQTETLNTGSSKMMDGI